MTDHPFWHNPLFWITIALFPMMYGVVIAVLLFTNAGLDAAGSIVSGAPWYTLIGFDPATRSGLINLIVGFIFGGVCGVWFGTTAQQRTAPTGPNERSNA